MKAWFPNILLSLASIPACLAHADAPVAANSLGAAPNGPVATPSAGARPSDEAIRAAVREVLAEMPDKSVYGSDSSSGSGTALSGGAYREFARKFSDAEKPHCLGANALKHQPPGFSTKNWNFGFGGFAALPFWGAAILRGKCSWSR